VTPPQHAVGTGSSGTGASSTGASSMGTPRTSPALTIDALGKKCPIPIIMLADRIREVRIGDLIAVLADDPAAKTDLPAWCALKSQDFVRRDDLQEGWSFLVRRCY
jgi:tRNA 2-thiouridine synthesizing protein A